MSFNNIPAELKALPAWICWRYEDIGAAKPTKIPYDPKTGKMASVTEPETWTTFNEAVSKSSSYSGIGFVFTDMDNYSFIDLDDTNGDTVALNRQIEIYRTFNSYSEVSPSGKDLHIIVKGKIPSGRRRSFIEIYSNSRYATFTGQIYNDKPIEERQNQLVALWQQMGSGPATYIYSGDKEQKFNDKEIIEQCRTAVNGDKFQALYSGAWEPLYQSQSEADYALIDIIAFYSQNRNQIIRVFRSSKLGMRDKAKRSDYISWMINKSFDRILPPIDIDGFKIALEEKLQLQLPLPVPVAQRSEPIAHNGLVAGSNPVGHTAASFNGRTSPFDGEDVGSNPAAVTTPSLPPGLIGEIAQFIYAAAPRPVPEIALAAAIGLMAGIVGRAYNISGTGLNQYVLVLANTGSGKEAAALGIDKLMNTIRLQVPTSSSFIGPSEIASGQALIKHISKTSPCFVSILGEFGLRLESMSSPNASSAEKTLKRVLLDLFNKSGHGQIVRQSIFADADKNIQVTEAPSFSILGESVPERFYSVLNEDMISEGLLPRFLLIEYNGPRPSLNEHHLNTVPSMLLIDKLATLVSTCEQIMHAKRVINIEQSPEAFALTRSFDKYCDAQINNTNKDVIIQLWNRAHIKMLKLSALIAVGVNVGAPVIMPEYVKWAIDMVQNDIRALATKFEQGMIGANTSEIKQGIDLLRAVREYLTSDWDRIKKYCQGKGAQMLHSHKVISYTFINRRLISAASFKNDRQGSTVAIKRAIQILLDSDKFREIGKQELSAKYGTTQRAFIVSDVGLLD